MKKIIIILTFNLFVTLTFAQEIPIAIIDRINQVDYVFEGVVVESNPYYVDNDRKIYTSNTIEIFKVFKGNLSCGTIELICEDGTIGDKEQQSSHTLNLKRNQIGVFMGKQTNREVSTIDFFPETNLEKLEATFEDQSYIKYWFDGFSYQASDLWLKYDSIAEFYHFSEQVTGYSYIDCNNSNILQAPNKVKSASSFLISLVYPLVVNGGVKDTLNIKGLNFGATRGNGNIFFKNANDGGVSEVFCEESDFILWSDTLIQLYVPSRDTSTNDLINSNKYPAGSGTIRVVLDDGEEEISDDFVTIKYSIFNSTSKSIQFIAPDSSFHQKFTFHCDTSVANFANGQMKAVIKRAIIDWACLTGINWKLGSDTFGVTSGNDQISMINFSNTLPFNVSARTNGYAKSCVGVHTINESDININSFATFFFDTFSVAHSSDSIDFYHTILHELGHAHHLYHKINPNSIMHFTAPNQRVVDLKNDIGCDDGGNSLWTQVCLKHILA